MTMRSCSIFPRNLSVDPVDFTELAERRGKIGGIGPTFFAMDSVLDADRSELSIGRLQSRRIRR